MYIDRSGATRAVIVLRKVVIKIPTFKSWKLFLNGMLANLQERQFSCLKDKNLCPVILSSRLGLFVVMRKCYRVNHIGLYLAELHRLKGALPSEFYLSDAKPQNFGYLDGRLVKLDYGN